MNIKLRLRNYGLWIAVIAFIPMVMESFGLKVLPTNYNEVMKAFLGILVLLGLVNDPTTDNQGFGDDK